jgi:hypothetical protein
MKFPWQLLIFPLAVYYTSATISGCFSGLIAYGVDKNMDGVHGFKAWQWLYIVEGIPAIGLGFIILFFLPSFPDIIAKRGSKYFTNAEIELALQRMAECKSPARNTQTGFTLKKLLQPTVSRMRKSSILKF